MWVLYDAEDNVLEEEPCILHLLQKALFSRRRQYIVFERPSRPIEVDGMELYRFISGSLGGDNADTLWEMMCSEGSVTRIQFSGGDYAVIVLKNPGDKVRYGYPSMR